ncbi:OpgC domain-containing protein [Marivirga lumbricoides]|uniref:OpgC domain-containing protein n=1 Tax=Marivirga lumbricoides TaxID=1046115 RepID=UPI0016634271
MKERVYFVDFARSYAIFLALFDHSLNDFNIWSKYPFEQYAIIKLFTSSATPTFLFLFGMMLELVYLKRLKVKGLSSIRPQLIKRSFQCYLGFMLTSLAGLIGGYMTVKGLLGSSIFVVNNHYGNILKIYCVLILLAIPMLLLRRNYGIWSLIILCFSFWIFYPITSQIEVANGNINNFTSFIFGVGNSGGPSVIHALSIVSLGMLSATFIDFNNRWKFPKMNMLLLLVIMSGICLYLFSIPFNDFIENYFSNNYRNNNHPLYYLVSLSLAIILILIFSTLIPLGIKLKPWTNHLLVFGRNSLSAFTIGNIILNLIYNEAKDYTFSIVIPLLFIILIYVILFAYEKVEIKLKKRKITYSNQ